MVRGVLGCETILGGRIVEDELELSRKRSV